MSEAEKIEKQNQLIKLRDQLNSGDISVEDVSPEDQKLLKALEAREERAVYLNCDHVLEDVTEERLRLVEERGDLPSWAKHLMEKADRPDRVWGRRREMWKTSKYEKCTSCGLLMISDQKAIEAE